MPATDYVIERQLLGNDRCLVFRGRADDGTFAIVKSLVGEPPDAREVETLRHEFQVAGTIETAGVLKPQRFGRIGSGLGLVYEDFDGETLRAQIQVGGSNIEDVLRIAQSSAEVLAEIHRQRVIHKNVNPDSLLYSNESQAVRFIDFSLSSELRSERPTAAAVSALEGDLRYVSPEQTGRMNRAIDHRADLYSLGVTLYELLVGRVPFEATDALGLVHAHIAREPVEPRHVRPEVPEVISDVVMKLLSKRSEDRYQSAAGLRNDVARILDGVATLGEYPSFPLGQDDRAEQLSIPEKLIGRERELSALTQAFERAARGRATFFVVSGYSGVGKSALIREVHRPIVERRGEFVSGKFDQFRREIPYSALTQALAEMIRRILAEPPVQVAAWKERVQAALGESGGVLTDLLPELELLVGVQAPAALLPPVEADARFRVVFERFVHAVATEDHPIALFIDDLQWADLATLDLVKRLIRAEESRHLLIIGAYRDNEVDADHPLLLTLEAMRAAESVPVELALGPLGEPLVAQLVAATVRDVSDRSRGLAHLVFSKTGGNPFFVQQFLTALYEDQHLVFDAENDRWQWDLRGIESIGITSNVVELMTKKIHALPESAARMLSLASCLGSEFDIQALALVAERERVETAEVLWPAVAEGLVLPRGDGYRYLRAARGRGPRAMDSPPDADSSMLHAGYRFLHDRVHEAAYELIEESDRPVLHLRIGRLLKQRYEAADGEDGLFEVVNHLNAGLGLLDASTDAGRTERMSIAKLNFAAGQRARTSSAWAPAASYFAAGRELVGEAAWASDYRLTLDMHRLGAEAEYMSHRVEQADALGEIVLSKVRDPLDGIPIYDLKIYHATRQAQLMVALEIALEALGQLGVHFPKQPNTLHVLKEVGRTKWTLLRRSRASLLDAPEMTDPRHLAALRLALQATPAAYQHAPNLLALLICKQVELVTTYGNCADAGQALVSWAVLVGGALGQLDGLYDYGALGVEVAKRYGDHGTRGRTNFHFDVFSRHWRDPLADSVAPLAEAGRLSAEGGDLQFYGYCLYHGGYAALFSGKDLPAVFEQFQQLQTALKRLDAEHAIPMGGAGLQYVMCLRGEESDPAALSGEWFSIEEMMPELERIGHKSAVAFALILDALLAYHFRHYDRALARIKSAWPLRDMIMTLPIEAELIHVEGLVRVALARRSRGRLRRKHLAVAKRRLAKMSHFAKKSPSNFAHKRDLLRAEVLDALGQNQQTAALYERATAGARDAGYLHDEAMAAERAFDSLRRQRRSTFANAYLRSALTAYANWGAQAKVDELAMAHPGQDAVRAAQGGAVVGESQSHSSLDVGTVVKASQVISKEIIFDRLLSRLVRLVIQNAGAQRGVLVRVDADGPVVEARGVEDYVELGGALAPIEDACASRAAIDYAIRTREPLCLDDAQADPRFQNDAYIQRKGIRSLLVVPTLAQDRVTGVLYVENDLAAGVFTEDRVELLRMVASQAAISMSNARLYTDIAALNQSYERFVPRPFLGLLERASIVDVELGDHVERDVTILFADIRGFTALSESLQPSETFEFINDYLGRVEPLISAKGGVIDKYVGDAVMAIFEGGPDAALAAALDVVQSLDAWNVERLAMGRSPIRVGIGVNSGPCMIGTIGARDRMDGTAIGDAVNVASRLESWTKDVGARLLISDSTRRGLSPDRVLALRPLGAVEVRGRAEAVTVHEVLDVLPAAERALRLKTRQWLSEGLSARSTGQDDVAGERLQQILAEDANDLAARHLLSGDE